MIICLVSVAGARVGINFRRGLRRQNERERERERDKMSKEWKKRRNRKQKMRREEREMNEKSSGLFDHIVEILFQRLNLIYKIITWWLVIFNSRR